MSTNRQATLPKQPTIPTDEEDDSQPHAELPPYNPRLSIDQGEIRRISVPEAIGLNFHSFIPQADITSQVHFFSNIQPDSPAGSAGLKDGDRILQINGVNVTSLEHEDVRKLMQLITPIVMTVANDTKYLYLLQQPLNNIEDKAPELPVVQTEAGEIQEIDHQMSRFDLTSRPSESSLGLSTKTSGDSNKSHRCEIMNLTHPDEFSKEEPLKVKICHILKSKSYHGFGLVLKFQQHLHVIGAVDETSPSFRAGLRENDVIIFVGKKNVEKLGHDEVKVMIRATVLASNQVDLTVLSKSDIPKYKRLQEKGLIDWSNITSDK